MKNSRVRAQIRNLCSLGLPGEILMPRLLPLIRELVAADSAGFFWVDATGHMTNIVAERMLTEPRMRLYFDRYYNGGRYDFRRNFRKRARSGEMVAVSVADEAFRRSDYYNDILSDLDAHHVLYGIARNRDRALGQLSLYRPRHAPAFTEGDQSALASVMHYISHAVASPPFADPTATAFVETDDDAVITVDHSGRILQATDDGRRLLVQAAGGSFSCDFTGSDTREVRALLTKLVTLLHEGVQPTLSCQSQFGQIQLRAYRLDNDADANVPLVVRIARMEPVILKFARCLRAMNLPPQQYEVALLLAQGLGNQAIAERMVVSENTVAYHVKQVLGRLDAHGRAELIERVIHHGE